MINDRRLTAKRHLGPAMQWAKPTRNHESREKKRQKITVDFEVLTDDAGWESSGSSSDKHHLSTSSDKHHNAGRSWGGWSSIWASPVKTQPCQYPSDHDQTLENRSARSHYSRPRDEELLVVPLDDQHRSVYDAREYYRLEDEPYFGDMSEVLQPYSNQLTREYESKSRENGYTVWSQYALPLLVVAIIIVLAFITLIL